jgi:predicted nucleotidyltransferase
MSYGDAMIVSSPIPLDTFEHIIKHDPEVLGVLYFGSLGRGTAGRFSDLDVLVWLPEELELSARDKLLQLLSLFGENHWLETGDRHVTGFVESEWTQVDIEFAQREHLVPSARYTGATVIKDTDGVLAIMAAACEPERLTETVESAADVIHGAISDLLFLTRHNARGSIWSARGNLTYQSTLLYELLGRLRGRRTYGYRYVEELLTPDEQVLLTAAWPCELTREENRRAARALWAWIQYVQREAERSIGQSLGVEVNEYELFAVIDRYYA